MGGKDLNISDSGHLTKRHFVLIAREGGIDPEGILARHLHECGCCRRALEKTRSENNDLREIKRKYTDEARQRRQDRSA